MWLAKQSVIPICKHIKWFVSRKLVRNCVQKVVESIVAKLDNLQTKIFVSQIIKLKYISEFVIQMYPHTNLK